MHILVLFLVLGVGADDIFVFMDAWRHGASMPLVDRMVYTYSHTAKAVFSTSFTTAVAFFTTAMSDIMPIASFGVFAGFAILMNYVLILTLWPAAVLICEIHFGRARSTPRLSCRAHPLAPRLPARPCHSLTPVEPSPHVACAQVHRLLLPVRSAVPAARWCVRRRRGSG